MQNGEEPFPIVSKPAYRRAAFRRQWTAGAFLIARRKSEPDASVPCNRGCSGLEIRRPGEKDKQENHSPESGQAVCTIHGFVGMPIWIGLPVRGVPQQSSCGH